VLAYHGTAERFLPKVLAKGLKPRGKKKSQWDVASRPDMVYMSIGYPFYYALQASEENERLLVLEIDLDQLDEDRFFPDEDFIAQAIANRDQLPLDDVHNFVRDNLEDYQHHWKLSLEKLGNCCYQGVIHPSAITQYCLFDSSVRPALGLWMSDPCITILNFAFCRGRYVGLVEWMFGHKQKLPDDEFMKLDPKRKEYWEKESKNREGIELRAL